MNKRSGKDAARREPSRKKKTDIPYKFVFDYLYPKEPAIRQMFGCFALYLGRKIIFILRKKNIHKKDNGVWIATSKEHHESLSKELPALRSISLFGIGPTNWQNIPESSDEFESSVIRACELVVKGDVRIGRIPKKKRKG